jgi:predicted Ser/Thr protein kinase
MTDLPPTVAAAGPPGEAPPGLDEVLARVRQLPPGEWVQAIRSDQAVRWRAGRGLPVEAYLDGLPGLADSPEDVQVLLCGEVMLRRERGEPADLAEYQRRFPSLADRLALVLPLLGALASSGSDGQPTLPPQPGPAGSPSAVPGYEIVSELGRGGMGVVFQARQTSLHRVVALKMILGGSLAGSAEVQRFRTEAEVIAALDHPHIVPIYEVGEHDGLPWFSMKLIDGGSLSEQLPRLARDRRAAVQLLAQVARAVHHAHQRGLLHRDLKPGNILLDQQGQPYVTDFGLARRLEGGSNLTQTGAIVGTPSYMAPEQAASQKGLTTAVDVYSLGAILYELLTGRPPFQAATPLDTVLQVLDQEPEPPHQLAPDVDRDLELICLKCLAKEPQQRYGSAEALAADLEHWLAGEPLSVRPPAFGSLLGLWLRQNFGAAGWTAPLGLGWGLLFGVLFWLDRASPVLTDARAASARLPSVPHSVLAGIGPVPVWFQMAGGLALVLMTSVIGLLVVLLVRPKNRAAAVAAGAATGLLAGLAAFAFGGGWIFVVATTRSTPNHRDSDLWLLSAAARIEPAPDPRMPRPAGKPGPGPAERLLERYPDLDEVPVQERGQVLYHKISADWSVGIPVGIWLGLITFLSVTVAVSLLETLAASILLGRLGQVRSMILPYIELVLPGEILVVGIVGGSLRLFAGWFTGHTGLLLALGLALVFLALTVTAVLRGWHWLVRGLLHLGWLGSLVVYAAMVMARFRQPGG